MVQDTNPPPGFPGMYALHPGHPHAHVHGHELYDRDRLHYELTMRQEPKQARMCGVGADRRPIDPPPIVQLRVLDPASSAASQDARARSPASSESSASDSGYVSHAGGAESKSSNTHTASTPLTHAASFLQNPYYFMFASLAKPDEDTELHWLKDGKTRCTTGSVVSSLYCLKDAEHNNEDAGFFVFPDLSVRTEGSYRLKLSLFEVVGSSVHHCKSIYSAPFYVYTAKKFPGMEESTPLSCSLADQGIKIRIRKDIRVRKRGQGTPGNVVGNLLEPLPGAPPPMALPWPTDVVAQASPREKDNDDEAERDKDDRSRERNDRGRKRRRTADDDGGREPAREETASWDGAPQGQYAESNSNAGSGSAGDPESPAHWEQQRSAGGWYSYDQSAPAAPAQPPPPAAAPAPGIVHNQVQSAAPPPPPPAGPAHHQPPPAHSSHYPYSAPPSQPAASQHPPPQAQHPTPPHHYAPPAAAPAAAPPLPPSQGYYTGSTPPGGWGHAPPPAAPPQPPQHQGYDQYSHPPQQQHHYSPPPPPPQRMYGGHEYPGGYGAPPPAASTGYSQGGYYEHPPPPPAHHHYEQQHYSHAPPPPPPAASQSGPAYPIHHQQHHYPPPPPSQQRAPPPASAAYAAPPPSHHAPPPSQQYQAYAPAPPATTHPGYGAPPPPASDPWAAPPGTYAGHSQHASQSSSTWGYPQGQGEITYGSESARYTGSNATSGPGYAASGYGREDGGRIQLAPLRATQVAEPPERAPGGERGARKNILSIPNIISDDR